MQSRPRVARHARIHVHGARDFGEHHHRAPERRQQPKVRGHRVDFARDRSLEQSRTIPSRDQTKTMASQQGGKRVRVARKLVTELDADVAGGSRLVEALLYGRVASKLSRSSFDHAMGLTPIRIVIRRLHDHRFRPQGPARPTKRRRHGSIARHRCRSPTRSYGRSNARARSRLRVRSVHDTPACAPSERAWATKSITGPSSIRDSRTTAHRRDARADGCIRILGCRRRRS